MGLGERRAEETLGPRIEEYVDPPFLSCPWLPFAEDSAALPITKIQCGRGCLVAGADGGWQLPLRSVMCGLPGPRELTQDVGLGCCLD